MKRDANKILREEGPDALREWFDKGLVKVFPKPQPPNAPPERNDKRESTPPIESGVWDPSDDDQHQLVKPAAKPAAPANGKHEGEVKHEGEASTDELQSICAAKVKMRAIDWLWPYRFAFGKLGIIAGLPDEGKGQIIAYIIAMITTAGLWPCDEGCAPKGKVVLLTAEDDIEDTVVPRLASFVRAILERKVVEIASAERGPSGGATDTGRPVQNTSHIGQRTH
jgi:hypothetical protein